MKHVMTSPAILGVVALGALTALSGCNATPVQVQAQNTGGTVPSSAPATPSAAGSSSSSASASSSSNDSSKVFFERILTDGAQLDQLIAISFSAQDSQTTTPNGIVLKTPQGFSPSPIFAPLGDQVVYLQSNGLVSDSLVSTALGTLATEPLYDYPTQVVAMSFSPSQKTAWIDETGSVSVTDLASGDSQAIPLPSGASATSIQLSTSGSSLFVLTSGDDLLVYELGQSQWTQVFQADSVSAAALGGTASGALAYVQSGKLYRFEIPAAGSVPSPILVTDLQSETVYDLTWSQDAGSVLYWAPLSTGEAAGEGEIRRVLIPSTTSSSVEQSLARISVPSGITSGVVCPAWVGHALYFSEFAQGEYQIERATPDTRDTRGARDTQKGKELTLGLPIPFAVPPASDEGFICPIVSQRSVP